MGKYTVMARLAIQSLIDHGVDVAISEIDLAQSFTDAEKNQAIQKAPGDIDFIVVYTGRTGLQNKTYIESANKFTLSPTAFDPVDTMRRLEDGVQDAIQCMKNNMLNGIYKPVFIYFNGGPEQNDELEKILQEQGTYLGLPAEFFIIRPIPLINTMGQVLDLSQFLEREWNEYCTKYGMNFIPNIAMKSSTYHANRIKLAVVNTSPLHTGEFWRSYWENNPVDTARVAKEFSGMIEYSLNPGERLKRAKIMVSGCDDDILQRPFGWKDAYCDMQAAVRYASLTHPPMKENLCSIANNIIGSNIVTSFINSQSGSLILRSTLRQCQRYLFHKHTGQPQVEEKTTNTQQSLLAL